MSPTRFGLLVTGASITLWLLLSATTATAGIGWTNDRGITTGKVSADQALQELLSSITTAGQDDVPRSSGAAPVCRWVPGYEAARNLRPESVKLIPVMDRVDPDGTRSRFYGRVCDGGVAAWQWLRVPDAADLVAGASAEIRRKLTLPHGVFSPAVTAGSVVANVPVWFAVPGQWAPVVATAAIPGAAVTVTATPQRLEFKPGDGTPPVSCVGPGPVFTTGMPEPDRPPACSYTYRDASTAAPDGRAWPAALTIHWQVGWAASNGETGTLAPLTTTTNVPVVVGQIQAIERAGR
ncbi:hypothetical protein [Protofrankia symbiont of Coriaria ruscifolia]|uniref:hypothetical protein n=1 Tax=Protofrankia symbiont of Coriaria ruscifolia TaxID=1306542 RepID=UPI001F5F2E19|nr:hypothetical protein [Protofrankia symbiont of Coriaria ruscifolia]